MSELKNSKIITYTIKTLIRSVSRRTSYDYAYSIVDNVLHNLQSKYDFLHYIKIQHAFYSENKEEIIVDPELDTIPSSDIITFVKELTDTSIQSIGKKADYFFIRELRDNFGFSNESTLEDFLLRLNMKQFEYIIRRQEKIQREKTFLQIKNSEVVQPVITALIQLFNKQNAETTLEKTFMYVKEKFEENYDFLHYISMDHNADDKGMQRIIIDEELDDIPSTQIAKELENLIEEIGLILTDESEQTFIDNFKMSIGENCLLKLNTIHIDLDTIAFKIRHQNRIIAQKVLQTIFDVVRSKTSNSSATTIIGETLILLQGIHAILDYIKITMTHDEEIIITIPFEINTIESYKLGMAFRDVITIIQENHKRIPLIEDFKKQLGDEYLTEIEKIGVNLHFLELRYT